MLSCAVGRTPTEFNVHVAECCDQLLRCTVKAGQPILSIVGSNYRYAGGRVSFEPAELFALVPRDRNRTSWRSVEDAVRKSVRERHAEANRLSEHKRCLVVASRLV